MRSWKRKENWDFKTNSTTELFAVLRRWAALIDC